jgi:hypothetical protein
MCATTGGTICLCCATSEGPSLFVQQDVLNTISQERAHVKHWRYGETHRLLGNAIATMIVLFACIAGHQRAKRSTLATTIYAYKEELRTDAKPVSNEDLYQALKTNLGCLSTRSVAACAFPL